jgi:hypothetical protein
VNRRHARFEALLPPRIRSRGGRNPGRGCRCRAGALLGFLPSRAFSILALGSALRGGTRSGGPSPSRMHLREPSRPASFAEPGPLPRILVSGIRWRARSIEPRTPPSGATPGEDAFATRQVPGRQPCSCEQSVLPAPPSLAAPRAFRALPSVAPRQSTRSEPRRRCREARSVGPSLCESFETDQLFWGSRPSSSCLRTRFMAARA